ncbi:DUF6226 family protein [Rathayibacter sp. AY1F9]|jgi:hypothetical protein|uniref:DUF6226 family protein n=1 Tax=Rathayibacter sp. AY1F9 TaxID=2080563 RepID=UPI000CE928F0|nr:DUF6226 family protein [Rathayibacter sp. AY1F9]PPH27153.1 hypothetical protein C5C37_14510 [Rathayibacter sp. AY1F9]
MTTQVFPGEIGSMPELGSSAIATFRPATELPAPVRFVAGFDPFVQFLQRHGVDPESLAGDVSGVWLFLAKHPTVLTTPEVADAAARFVGNVIAVVHPAATWRVTNEPEVGTNVRSIPVATLVRTMVQRPEQREPFLEMLSTWDQEDLDDREITALAHDVAPPPFTVPPVPFQRAAFPPIEFRDDNGHVIEYGQRWPDHHPPDDAYSRVSHPERFAPLRRDVDALADYLHRWYSVDVRHLDHDGTHQIRLQPRAGAPITVTATDESVQVEAGVFFRATLPNCSCDACDESAETAADRLEEAVLSIAAGGFRETYPLGSRRWLHTQLHAVDGSGYTGSSGAPDTDLTTDDLEHATTTLRQLDSGWWPAWPLRTPNSPDRTGDDETTNERT